MRDHNRRVKATGQGVRLVVCQLPIKSPWLHPIEPEWVHTKRQVVEPDRLLPARELAERGCDAPDCPYLPHIPIPDKVASSCTSSRSRCAGGVSDGWRELGHWLPGDLDGSAARAGFVDGVQQLEEAEGVLGAGRRGIGGAGSEPVADEVEAVAAAVARLRRQ